MPPNLAQDDRAGCADRHRRDPFAHDRRHSPALIGARANSGWRIQKRLRSVLRLLRVPASRPRKPAMPPGSTIAAPLSSNIISASDACAVTSAAPLIQGRSGWRRMVPVAVQGASISTSGAVPSKSRASLSTTFAVRPVRARFSRIRASRAGSQLDRDHLRAARRQLQGLAAGRGAKIDHLLARDIAQQQPPARSPPRPAPTNRRSAKPGRSSTRPSADRRRDRPNRAVLSGYADAVAFQRDVQRRFLCMGVGDGARDVVRHIARSSVPTASPAC